MKRIFVYLIIFFCISAVLLIGISFYFSRDTLIQFKPPETNFYLHLNFNQLSYQGYRALEYFSQHWPADLLTNLLTDKYSAFKYNLSSDLINQVDEAAIFEIDSQPVVIYKYKSIFADFPLVLGGQKGPRIFYRFFDKRTAALALNSELLLKISSQPSKFIPDLFKKINLNFVVGSIKNQPFTAFINQEMILLKSSSPFLDYSIDRKIDQIIGLAPFLTEKGSFLIAWRDKNHSPAQIKEMIEQKLSFYFPREIERPLPDQSKIIELVADPTVLKNGRSGGEMPSVLLTATGNYIFLSDQEASINQYLKGKDFVKNCLSPNPDEIFYWQPSGLGFSLIMSGQQEQTKAAIEGCLAF